MDRETRSSILPVRTRYRFSSVVERGPPKPDVDCSIQSAGANFFSCLGGPLAGMQPAVAVCAHGCAHFINEQPVSLSGRAASVGDVVEASSQ